MSYKGDLYFGTISLNNSIFNLPAGVSPMLTSMNTIGRVEEDICEVRLRPPERTLGMMCQRWVTSVTDAQPQLPQPPKAARRHSLSSSLARTSRTLK